jgi:hypothetical protein
MAGDVTLKGMKELKKRLNTLGNLQQRVISGVLQEEAQAILNASQGIVPVDTGALKASGKVSEVVSESGALSINVSYGSDEVGYAQYVHEIHKTQPKFLERPLRAAVGGFERRLADKLKQEVEKN